MKIQKFVNNLFDSNTYLIEYNLQNGIIIDPCENLDFFNYLVNNSIEPKFIFLTHEHIDHISGTNYIKNKYPDVQIVCSEYSSNAIVNPKKNLSAFYQIDYISSPADIMIKGFTKFDLDIERSVNLNIFGGHSLGVMFININNSIFIGDQFIYKTKTVTKLPGGSKKELLSCYDYLKNSFADDTILFPGHGEEFLLRDLAIW